MIAIHALGVRVRKPMIMPLLGLVLVAAIGVSCDRSGYPSITVYKSPTCGCCTKWMSHLRDAGFAVTGIDVRDLDAVKAMNGVPHELSSCHTAVVDGYVIEGHVPAEDVLRLVRERPPVAGLAVPGMPIGSPGMEGQNPERYVVYAFATNGSMVRFATHGP